MSKKFRPRPTAEQIEELRNQWRTRHPEEYARREAKRNPVSLEREEGENIDDVIPVVLTDSEKDAMKKEMMALWNYMFNRRHEYLVHRNLEQAALTEDEKARFKEYILRYEGVPGFSLETENLLIDGLKYPEKDHDLANFCFKYLEKKYDEGAEPSISMWIQMWNRDFVPLDAIRLMIKHDGDSGRHVAVEAFREMMPLLVNKIRKHLKREEERLALARELEIKSPERTSQSGRRARRLFYFQTLLYAFGYDVEW